MSAQTAQKLDKKVTLSRRPFYGFCQVMRVVNER